jgi:hypothetical protein
VLIRIQYSARIVISAAWRGETHPARQHLLAGLHDWLAGLNYQARSMLALIWGVVAALA